MPTLPDGRPRIALCIIANLADPAQKRGAAMAIHSTALFADWGFVIDTGDFNPDMKDRSIIGGLGCTIISYPWDHSFSNPRNHALNAARQVGAEWAIILDSDELLHIDTPSLLKLRSLIKRRKDYPSEGYLIPLYNEDESGNLLKPGDWQPRVIPVHSRVKYIRRAHNLIVCEKPNGTVEPFRHWYQMQVFGLFIRHSGYADPKYATSEKAKRSLDLLHQDFSEKAPTPGLTAYYLARQHILMGNTESARRWLDICFDCAKSEAPEWRGLYITGAEALAPHLKIAEDTIARNKALETHN